VILEGAAEILKATPNGPLKLLRLGDGAFLGSAAALLSGDNVRSTTVVACGNIQLGIAGMLSCSATNWPAFQRISRGLIKSLDHRLRLRDPHRADAHARNPAFMQLIKANGWPSRRAKTKSGCSASGKGTWSWPAARAPATSRWRSFRKGFFRTHSLPDDRP